MEWLIEHGVMDNGNGLRSQEAEWNNICNKVNFKDKSHKMIPGSLQTYVLASLTGNSDHYKTNSKNLLPYKVQVAT